MKRRLVTRMRVVVWTLLLVLALSVGAVAGEYYLSDEDRYWWYWDGSPNYEVLIPSSAYAYVQVDWAGTTSLEVALGEKGPLLVAGTMPGTDVDRAWNALSARWAAAVESSRTTTNSTIETDNGLTARFRVLEANPSGGPKAIVRMVAFEKGGRLAYLAFIGNEEDYAGDARQYWLRAVHSFDWRS